MGAFSHRWLRRARFTAVPAIALAAATAIAVSAPGAHGAQGAQAAVQQPVDTHSMADPGVTLYKGNFYAFSTGGFGLMESTAPTAGGPWTAPANVMTKSGLPSWISTSGGVWAPDMTQIPGSGKFVVYFSARLNPAAFSGPRETPVAGARCVGAAESSSPQGPFTVQPHPVVCLKGYGAADDMTADPGKRVKGEGAIDADPVIIDNGWDNHTAELFLVYKTQSGTGQATIRMVRLNPAANGTGIVGDSHQLLAAIPTGSGGGYVYGDTIEGPSLLALSDGWFLLFVARGNFTNCGYSTQWFKSLHPWSWTQTGGTTILSQSQDGLCGPGGADVSGSEVSGQYRLFFHAYASGTPGTRRELYADVLTIAPNGSIPHLTPLTPSSAA